MKKMKSTLSFFALAAVSIAVAGAPLAKLPSRAWHEQEPAVSTGQIIIKYRGFDFNRTAQASAALLKVHRDSLQTVAARRNMSIAYKYENNAGMQVWQLSKSVTPNELGMIAKEIQSSDSTIIYAAPNSIMTVQGVPSDPLWGQQWNMQNTIAGINGPAAWNVSTGKGIVVAVLDSGFITTSPDFPKNNIAGIDFVFDQKMGNDGERRFDQTVDEKFCTYSDVSCIPIYGDRDYNATDPGDWTSSANSTWHGTAVAGVISALANNGRGMTGVAPDSRPLNARVTGSGGGTVADAVDAIYWASGMHMSKKSSTGYTFDWDNVAEHPKVINLSVRSHEACNAAMKDAITYANQAGITVVVAAGNDNADVSTASPANCPGVIAVAAHTITGERAPYSNYGSGIDISAPGGVVNATPEQDILTIDNTGATKVGADGWAGREGTSFAAPHVSGVVALMLQANPALTPAQVKTIIKSSAHPFVANCSGCGVGMLDAYAAVMAAKSTPLLPWSISSTSGGTAQKPVVSATVNVAQADVGKTGNLYVAAILKDGSSLYLNSAGAWVTGGTTAPAFAPNVILGSHTLKILDGSLDVTALKLSGTVIYAGYGLTQYDLITNSKYKSVYIVQ